MHSFSLATLKAVQNDSTEMLNVVCEFPSNSFEAATLQQALVMAVEKNSALNVAQLARGTQKLPSINEALTRAKETQAYGAYTVLLMLQAAYSDDSQLVLALFGKETADVPLMSNPIFGHIQAAIHSEEFPINIILEIAEHLGSKAFCTAVKSASMERSHSSSYFKTQEPLCRGSRDETDNSGALESTRKEKTLSLTGDARLHRYCHDGNIKRVQKLLAEMRANMVDIKAMLCQKLGVFGYTPLHEASTEGHSHVLELLLKENGPVNAKASSGYTSLHLAASGGHSECARLLLQHGADLTAKDEYQKTPLHTAELSARTGVVKVLRSHGEPQALTCMCGRVELEKLALMN